MQGSLFKIVRPMLLCAYCEVVEGAEMISKNRNVKKKVVYTEKKLWTYLEKPKKKSNKIAVLAYVEVA